MHRLIILVVVTLFASFVPACTMPATPLPTATPSPEITHLPTSTGPTKIKPPPIPSQTPGLTPASTRFPLRIPAQKAIPTTPSVAWEKKCEDWTELRCGDFILSNNVWGKGDVIKATQCISAKEVNGQCIFKWEWDWPDSGSMAVRAYPELIYGWKPWSSSSTTEKLPIKLRDITEINLKMNANVYASGVSNTAFDLWLTSSPTPRPENIKREVMIWLGNVGWPTGGNKIDTVKIQGEDYDLYKAPMNTWTYFSFVRVHPRTNGSLDIAAFLEYLIEHSHVASSEYLASIEFGNEIINGQGTTYVNLFDLKIP
jgi:hypothetical protein